MNKVLVERRAIQVLSIPDPKEFCQNLEFKLVSIYLLNYVALFIFEKEKSHL